MKPFTEYLQAIHYNEHPTILDDDLPDHFENWIENQELETLGNTFTQGLLDNVTTIEQLKKQLIRDTLKDIT